MDEDFQNHLCICFTLQKTNASLITKPHRMVPQVPQITSYNSYRLNEPGQREGVEIETLIFSNQIWERASVCQLQKLSKPY